MADELIYKIDIDELIFARKNREYGAYKLRKAYRRSLAIAMWITILIVILVTIGPVIYKMIYLEEKGAMDSVRVIITELAPPPSIGEKKDAASVETPPSLNGSAKKEENFFYDFAEFEADPSAPEQTYSEPTLDVSLKYPNGWTYIDQNVKNKLDGVTFWLVKSNYNPPPYIHLEVKEKYLFDPARFKYKVELKNSVGYYNDPEELEGQVSQVIYIRTNTDEDYSLKLIMKGRNEFKSFQPVFFNIVKSFQFGESFF